MFLNFRLVDIVFIGSHVTSGTAQVVLASHYWYSASAELVWTEQRFWCSWKIKICALELNDLTQNSRN